MHTTRELTIEEKREYYNTLTKKQLVEMLIESNKALERLRASKQASWRLYKLR